jgi:hypothetical protein
MSRVGDRAPIRWHLTNGGLNKLLAAAHRQGVQAGKALARTVQKGHNHPTSGPEYWHHKSNGAAVTEDTRWEWAAGCPVCKAEGKHIA